MINIFTHIVFLCVFAHLNKSLDPFPIFLAKSKEMRGVSRTFAKLLASSLLFEYRYDDGTSAHLSSAKRVNTL